MTFEEWYEQGPSVTGLEDKTYTVIEMIDLNITYLAGQKSILDKPSKKETNRAG